MTRIPSCTLVAAGLLIASWWFLSAPSVRVSDVRKAETITLQRAPGRGHVHGTSIWGSGRLDGEAVITLMLAGRPYRTEKLQGPIRFEWGGDWYADTERGGYFGSLA